MRISFDIDGVFTDYPQCWIEYANAQTDLDCLTKQELKSELGSDGYDELKSRYRRSEHKATLDPQQELVAQANAVADQGHSIIVASSRPMDTPEFPNLRNLTHEWLTRNDIPFDRLVKKTVENLAGTVDCHVEDELSDARKLADAGVTVLLYDSVVDDHERIQSFKNPDTLPRLLDEHSDDHTSSVNPDDDIVSADPSERI